MDHLGSILTLVLGIGSLLPTCSYAADTVPPSDINDLTASPGSRGGALDLSWYAPYDDQNGGDIVNGWYRIDFSSESGHVFDVTAFRLQFSTNTTGGTWQGFPLGSLMGNATYYARVYTADDVPNWSGLSNGATALTPAYPPTDARHSASAQDSITWGWSSGTNISGTEQFAQDETGSSNWLADALGWFRGGKSPNTLYHLTVKARNSAYLESASASAAAYTAIETPAVLVFDSVAASSLTARVQPTPSNLTAGSSGVRITNADLATDSGWVQRTSWTSTGLSSNQQYQFTAKARNGDGDETPSSPPAFRYSGLDPPSAAALTATFLSTADITMSLSQPPNPSAGQTGSEFVNTLGAAYGGNGSGQLTGVYAFTDHDLLPNTSYSYRAQYFNGDGVASGYGPALTRYTRIEIPDGVVFEGVGPNSVSARAAGTLTNLGAGASGLRILNLTNSASSGWITTRSWVSAGLSSNTAYSFAAQAINGDSVVTAQSGASVRFTTLEPPPASALSLPARTSTQMTVSLAQPPNPVIGQTGCEIESTEGPGGSGSGRLVGAYSYPDGGLTPNTRYGYRAKYYNAEDSATAFGAVAYGYTMAAPPLASAFSEGGDFQMRASWGANANPGWTEYLVELSTDSFATLAASSRTADVSALLTGLSSDTTYYARVRAFNQEGTATATTDLGSTKTWSTVPRFPGHTGQTQTQISWSWSWGRDNTGADEFYASDESGSSGWIAGAAAWTSGGKAANTQYHMSVKSRSPSGVQSASVSTAAYTAIEPSAGVGYDGIWSSSVTVRALGSFSGLASGASGILLANESGGSSGWGGNVPWTSTALSSNTAYTFRARTRNGDGLEPGPGVTASTYTRLNAPLAGELTLVAESSTSMRVSVRLPPNSGAGGTGWEALNTEGAGGTGSGRMIGVYTYLDSGLAVNTRYAYRARYFNAADQATEYGGIRTLYTQAAEPSPAAYTGVSETALQANWGAGGNWAGTEYTAQLSTDGFATVAASSTTADQNAVFSGLDPDKSYQARVRALNAEGAPTAWTSLGAARTSANPPGNPGHTGQTQTQVSWSWSLGSGNPPSTEYDAADESGSSGWIAGAAAWTSAGKAANTRYNLSVRARNQNGVLSPAASTAAYTAIEAATGVGLDGIWASSVTVRALGSFSNLSLGASGILLGNDSGGSSGWGGNVPWTSTALSSNTAYAFRARTRNGDGSEPGAGVAVSTFTLLNAPLAGEITLVAESSVSMRVSVRLPPNSGAGQTGSEFANTEGPGGTGSGRLTGAYTYLDSGLAMNTRYGYRARYFNAANQATDYGDVKYAYTLAYQPASLAYTGLNETGVQANWGANGNLAGTEYVAQVSTDGFSTLVTSSRTANTFAVFSGLRPNTQFTTRVHALNADGAPTNWTSLGVVRTWANPPSAPRHSGQGLSQVSWAWTAGLNNPASTEYYAWDESGSSGWAAGASAWTSGGKAANTLYNLGVRARNQAGVLTASVSTTAYTAIEAATGVGLDAVSISSVTVRALGSFSNLALGASGILLGNDSGGSSGWGGNVPWTSTALSSNTAYAFRARTRNGDGFEPGTGVVVSTFTLLNAPLAGEITLVAESSVSMRVSVRLPPNSGAGQTGSEFANTEGPGGSGSGRLTGTYETLDLGLTLNTRYGYRARYFNASNQATAYGGIKTGYTLAALPAAAAYTAVSETSAQANWGDNGNWAGTEYTAQLSTDAFTTLAASSRTANLYAAFSGLEPDKSYSGRVLAWNAESVPNAGTLLGPVWTNAVPPASPSITLAGGPALTVSWGANGNQTWTQYEAQASTSADFYPIESSTRTTGLSGRISGLTPSTTYYVRVQAWAVNGAPTAFADAGSTVTLSDVSGPPAITDLAAATGDVEGRIRLTWTAPADAVRTIVRYSPAPILSLGDFDGASLYVQSWTPAAPGAREDRMLQGFSPGATYYLAVVSEDAAFNRSGLPNQTSAWAQWDLTPPSKVLDLAVVWTASTSARLRWTTPGDDASTGQADRYDLRMSPLGALDTLDRFLSAKSTTAPSPAAAGQTEYSSITGLSESTTYYFALRAADERSNWSQVSGTVVLWTSNTSSPAAPGWAGPAVSSGQGSVSLDWLDNAEDDLAGYRLWRAGVSGGPYARVQDLGRNASGAVDSGLTVAATYYYALTAVDSAGLESPLSAELLAYVPDGRAPEPPPGLKGLLGDDGRYRLYWNAAASDGDLAGYRVYRAAGQAGPYVLQASLGAGTLAWTEPAAQGGGYYLVRAADSRGNESGESLICGPDLSLSAASADGWARARVPSSIADPLYRVTNGYGEDIRLRIERRAAEEAGKTLLSYEFIPLKTDSLTPAGAGFSFPKPKAELSFKVPGFGAAAAGGAAVYWWDGFEWVRIGGELDPATGMLTARVARLGRFQVRQAARAESFSIMHMTPHKIFTPNGDGINDVIEFFFENDSDWVVSEAKVYDLSGAQVSDMRVGGTGTSYVWDGKDKSGRAVHAGIYIYQFQAGGKTLNGTVVVAR